MYVTNLQNRAAAVSFLLSASPDTDPNDNSVTVVVPALVGP